MQISSLIFYLNSKYEEDKEQEVKQTYLIDLTSVIAKRITGNKNIKLWSELEKKLYSNNNNDKRSAKEIEEDVLNKFRNLERQG